MNFDDVFNFQCFFFKTLNHKENHTKLSKHQNKMAKNNNLSIVEQESEYVYEIFDVWLY